MDPIELTLSVETAIFTYQGDTEAFEDIDRDSYTKDKIEYIEYLYYDQKELLERLIEDTKWTKQSQYVYSDPQNVFQVSVEESTEGWEVKSTEDIATKKFTVQSAKRLAIAFLCYTLDELDPIDLALQAIAAKASREVLPQVLSEDTIERLHSEHRYFISDVLEVGYLTGSERDQLQELEGAIKNHRLFKSYKKVWFVSEV